MGANARMRRDDGRGQAPGCGGLAGLAGGFEAAVAVGAVAEGFVVGLAAAAERHPLPVGDGVVVAALVDNLDGAGYAQDVSQRRASGKPVATLIRQRTAIGRAIFPKLRRQLDIIAN